MRALSLWQPHASLCCLLRPEPNPLRIAEKPFETRGEWASRVQLGDLVIHAAKADGDVCLIGSQPFLGVLVSHGIVEIGRDGITRSHGDLLPFGAALGVVEVVAVWRTNEAGLQCVRRTDAPIAGRADLPMHTRQFGDFSPGRTLLQLQNVRPLSRPLPMRGRQGLFTLTTEEESAVRELLPTT